MNAAALFTGCADAYEGPRLSDQARSRFEYELELLGVTVDEIADAVTITRNHRALVRARLEDLCIGGNGGFVRDELAEIAAVVRELAQYPIRSRDLFGTRVWQGADA